MDPFWEKGGQLCTDMMRLYSNHLPLAVASPHRAQEGRYQARSGTALDLSDQNCWFVVDWVGLCYVKIGIA